MEEDGELASIQASPDQAESMGEEPMEPPAPRVHESDKKGDVKSLDRLGERNLYLLIRGKDHTGKDVWRFPQGGLQDGEFLHQVSYCGTIQAYTFAKLSVVRLRCATFKPRLARTWTHGWWARSLLLCTSLRYQRARKSPSVERYVLTPSSTGLRLANLACRSIRSSSRRTSSLDRLGQMARMSQTLPGLRKRRLSLG